MSIKGQNCLVEKFRGYTVLDEWEMDLLDSLQVNERPYTRGGIVHPESSMADFLYVVRSGWFAGVKELSDGNRVIVEVALPGDVIGLRDVTFKQHLSALQCLSKDAVICEFSKYQLH